MHGQAYTEPARLFVSCLNSKCMCRTLIFAQTLQPVPVPQPSSIRGLATPWTYFLHLSLSSSILIDSSTESPVHVLMLSIQAVRGLPQLNSTQLNEHVRTQVLTPQCPHLFNTTTYKTTRLLLHVLIYPRLRAPGIVPCIISFSRQLPCFLIV